MDGRLPDFLGLGVQKGGTTSLHCLLEQHPQVFLPSVKEVHYFSLNFASGEAWYRSQFASAEPEQRCGEITPYYLFHPQAAARVREALPQAKLIVLLRDPVERTLSQYFHSRRHGFEPLGLEAALDATPITYIQNRFRFGKDKETTQRFALTPDEQKLMQKKGAINGVVERKLQGKQILYGVTRCGRKDDHDIDWEMLVNLEMKDP